MIAEPLRSPLNTQPRRVNLCRNKTSGGSHISIRAATVGSGTTVIVRLSIASCVGWLDGPKPCKAKWVNGVALEKDSDPHCVEVR